MVRLSPEELFRASELTIKEKLFCIHAGPREQLVSPLKNGCDNTVFKIS